MDDPNQRHTILVIEDDQLLLQSLNRVLDAEYHVLLADSVEAGLSLLRSTPVQVILTNHPLELPGEVAGEFPQAVRLIYTGGQDAESLAQIINTGHAYRFLPRPWDSSEMWAAIHGAAQAYEQLTLNPRRKTQSHLEGQGRPAQTEAAAGEPLPAEASPLRDDLLTITSHDLRSPLATIQSAAELLGNPDYTFSDTERHELVQIIDNNATHLIALVNDMLDLAKIESGKMELEVSDVLMSEVAQQSVKALGFNAKKKGISLSLEVAPGEMSLRADRLKLYRVMSNLLGNAIKFTSSGGQVKVLVKPDPAGMQVQVIDSGLGIARDELPGIFEKYIQSRTRSTAGEKGTGLGLAIVKQLVELHGGQVEVASELGRGSTFSIHVPLRPA